MPSRKSTLSLITSVGPFIALSRPSPRIRSSSSSRSSPPTFFIRQGNLATSGCLGRSFLCPLFLCLGEAHHPKAISKGLPLPSAVAEVLWWQVASIILLALVRAFLGQCLITLIILAVTSDSSESRRHTAMPNCDVQTCRSP